MAPGVPAPPSRVEARLPARVGGRGGGRGAGCFTVRSAGVRAGCATDSGQSPGRLRWRRRQPATAGRAAVPQPWRRQGISRSRSNTGVGRLGAGRDPQPGDANPRQQRWGPGCRAVLRARPGERSAWRHAALLPVAHRGRLHQRRPLRGDRDAECASGVGPVPVHHDGRSGHRRHSGATARTSARRLRRQLLQTRQRGRGATRRQRAQPDHLVPPRLSRARR